MTSIGADTQGAHREMDAQSVVTRKIGAEVMLSRFLISQVCSAMNWINAMGRLRDRIAYRLLCQLDRCRRHQPSRLATVRCPIFPKVTTIAERSIYITANRHLCKWASFRCPGGCGKIVRLQLSPKVSPRWRIKVDWLGRASLSPSVRQLTRCGCHFWLRGGCVEWCADNTESIVLVNDQSSDLRSPHPAME